MFNLEVQADKEIELIEARIELTEVTIEDPLLPSYTRKRYKRDLKNLRKALTAMRYYRKKLDKLSM